MHTKSLPHSLRSCGIFISGHIRSGKPGSLAGNKNPAAGCGSDLGCGERGIRTPGSVVTDQRFSRPPHSTTLPFLRRKYNIFLLFALKFHEFS
jgi:hypothetical protein